MVSRLNLRSDQGFALMEAIVSAAVLAVVALAVLSGIDGASNSTGREKARAIAADLAEKDQEYLRSLPITSLTALSPDPRTTTVGGVKYTIQSTATWVTDDQGGTPSCGNSSSNDEYLHLTTTVTSSVVGTRTKPVRIDSLMAPSVAYENSHGTLGVKVTNASNVGVKGISVSAAMSSPAYSPPAATTDDQGCVLFRNVPSGTYTITLNQYPYVDQDGDQLETASQKVSPGTVSFTSMTYDIGTKWAATVKTNVPGSPASAQDSQATAVSYLNGGNTGLFGTVKSGTPAGSFDNVTAGKRLYPFKSPAYGFFTGSCEYESPDKVGSGLPAALLADPSQPQPQPVTVTQPPFNLQVTPPSGGNLATETVTATLQPVGNDGCSEPAVTMAIRSWPASGWGTAPGGIASGWVVQGMAGALAFDPGMPYGKYLVCLKDTSKTMYASLTYDNTKPGGQTTTTPVSSWSNTKATGC